MFSFQDKIIIIISSQDWGNNLLSKHLYAKELSKKNQVYYIYTTAKESLKENVTITSINENLHLVHFKTPIKGISKLPSFMIDLQTKKIIHQFFKKTELNKVDLVWNFDQSKFQNLTPFKAEHLIFHPVDYIIQANPYKARIADGSDLILSVSQAILDQVNTKTPKHFINHGLDEIFLNYTKIEKPVFLANNKINIGYLGNLRMKLIDWKNMIKAVQENKQINFVFMGPNEISNLGGTIQNQHIQQLKTLPNTYFTGELTKEEIVKIFPYFDLFWLCYDSNTYSIEVSNSHKILEYLSTGKTVISNYISSYQDTNLLEMVENNEAISDKIKIVTRNLENYNSTEKCQQRINFAKENTYKKQLERIETIINTLNTGHL